MRLRNQPWILLCDVGPIPGLNDPNAVFARADGYLSPNAAADASGQTPPGAAGYSQQQWPSAAEASQRMNAPAANKYNDPTPHLSYIRHLQMKQPPRTILERFGAGYQDYLQAPLQPLTVNLESNTYEVFEKDPIKYEWYERAIAKALQEWVAQRKPTSNPDGRVVIAVVGAGRGPLVTRALRASESTGVPVDVWAVEKNPNAYVLLQHHNETTWKGQVTVVKSDMRSWKGPSRATTSAAPIGQAFTTGSDTSSPAPDPETSVPSPLIAQPAANTPIDILVSELLGSFADNELSPECLDGIQHLLNPTHGISIPASYTAHITPISAPRLHADVSARLSTDPDAAEIPYVVMLHAVDYLSTLSSQQQPSSTPNSGSGSMKTNSISSTSASNSNSKATAEAMTTTTTTPNVLTTWSFSHPSPHLTEQPATNTPFSNLHNARSARLSFPCRDRGVCHGLAGYFETVLYGDVELSTNPLTMEAKSGDMISWFPIYFPLKVRSTPPFISISTIQTSSYSLPPIRITMKANDAYRHLSTHPTTPNSSSASGAKQTTEKSGTSGWSSRSLPLAKREAAIRIAFAWAAASYILARSRVV